MRRAAMVVVIAGVIALTASPAMASSNQRALVGTTAACQPSSSRASVGTATLTGSLGTVQVDLRINGLAWGYYNVSLVDPATCSATQVGVMPVSPDGRARWSGQVSGVLPGVHSYQVVAATTAANPLEDYQVYETGLLSVTVS